MPRTYCTIHEIDTDENGICWCCVADCEYDEYSADNDIPVNGNE